MKNIETLKLLLDGMLDDAEDALKTTDNPQFIQGAIFTLIYIIDMLKEDKYADSP